MEITFRHKKITSGISYFLALGMLLACNGKKVPGSPRDFGAYYTHIVTNFEFEKTSRTGEYADIIVDLGIDKGKFIFWRGSSYLPYLETVEGNKIYVDEVLPRSGDGSKTMPDKLNSFSVVKIIENDENKVVIHWRYLPEFGTGNPFTNVVSWRFVDEYFTINRDGSVHRIIRQGTPKYDDWSDPDYAYIQSFKLTSLEITEKVLNQPVRSLVAQKITGRPVVENSFVRPVAWFRFDEAAGDTTYESISYTPMEVKGTKSYWRQGVSGTSLQFDDVSTYLSLPASKAPEPVTAITLEGWVSIGAYPWNWCPIIQQTDDTPEELKTDLKLGMGNKYNSDELRYKKENDRGYFLGIDSHGHPGVKIRTGGNWEELTSGFHLERKKWYHIAATYDKNTGLMSLYINGEPGGKMKVQRAGNIELSKKNVQIGRGKQRRQTNPVRGNTFPDYYSFDGLLDEIKIYNLSLTPEQVKESFKNFKTDSEFLALSDIPPRILPGVENAKGFGAEYSALKYFDSWDNLFRFSMGADIVVSFADNPGKFVFWRGVSYIPMIVNEKNEWYSNEFNETWGKSGGNGCQEPMSDKSSEYSHVRIIENTPARVVVHWRCSLLDVNHVRANENDTTGWSDWSDWYYYIYPDGVAAKKMQLWTNGERNHEWQESMLIFGPDQHPHDIIERTRTITMLSEDGKYKEYDWQNSPPEDVDEPENSNIQLINLRAEYDPFTIATEFVGTTRVYAGEMTPYAVFCTWNHWPIAQMPSDGRYASFPDRTSHSSITNVYLPVYKEMSGDKPFYEKIMLEGLWNKNAVDLIPLSKSWTHAPELINLKEATGAYNMEQRAYILKVSGNPVTFTVNSSEANPVQNICFVLKGWNSGNEAVISGAGNVKQGLVRDVDGSFTRVIFIEKVSTVPFDITISK